jgi:hypothetical protein
VVDFTAIVGGTGGQRDGFEELVCQIARRSPPDTGSEYRRIHGAGGDGGVEAVWILTNGDEVGYQAKFYTTSRDVDWSAIDDSVTTALKTHPRLTKMFVAIACVLTAQTARTNARGRPQISGWGQWENHKKRWEDAATELGRSLEFVPWTAAELSEILTLPAMIGKLEYWFGAIELSPVRLERWCARTVAALEERYHPEDHVVVSTRAIFDGLQKNEAFRDSIRSARANLTEEAKISLIPLAMPEADRAHIESVRKRVASILDAMRAVDDADGPYPYPEWRDALLQMRTDVFKGLEQARAFHDALQQKAKQQPAAKPDDDNRESTSAQYLVDALGKLQDSVSKFLEVIDAEPCLCEASRFALLDGRAGSGKSHLIASEIERSLTAGCPAIFLLGTDFSAYGSAEAQILSRLEIDSLDFDKLLGVLSAKAETSGQRGLIAIDAINEGAGTALWRTALVPLANRVLAHSNLSFCVSYRSEYGSHLVTDGAKSLATVVEVKGFETPEEIEEAARVYMDKRGIVRPSSPRLDPEFSNPLFLRTACLALERDGRQEFPRGMRGTTEVLSFFLTSTARHLGTDYDGGDALVVPTRRALLGLAGKMADDRTDYIERPAAFQLINDAFTGFVPPTGKTWLEQLRFRGLLRFDPHPEIDHSDPLSVRNDVVRFSFQRFQDHLIASALLDGSSDPTDLFQVRGKLEFMLDEYGIGWLWRGVFYASYVIIADIFAVEAIDLLPGGFQKWWDRWNIQDAFVESVRWRTTSAFSDRTRELLNRLNWNHGDTISLLIELAVIEGHPWNSEFLHANLVRRKLAPRDAFWTQSLNDADYDQGHPIWRLIDWCLGDGPRRASDDVLALAAKVLAWAGSSTSWTIRDRAAKGLTCILLARPVLAEGLFAGFDDCDDPYVVERLYAVLYGASLRLRDPSNLALFSKVAWDHCFAEDKPPVHFLTRDYARGVIELAATEGQLPAEVDLELCRPPYKSKPPVFNFSEARVTARSDRIGAGSIIGSCYRGIADFGRYTLESPVQTFAAAPLSGPRPETSEELFDRFRSEVIQGNADRTSALETLQAAYAARKFVFDEGPFRLRFSAEDTKRIDVAFQHLLGMLSPEEQKRFEREALPRVQNENDHGWLIPGRGKDAVINAQQAKLWVASRAMSLGWTDKLFPYDRGRGDRDMQAGRIERIGKKYQRIGLMELLARLADNYWLKPDWGTAARAYDNPTDVSFMRDLEVSVFPRDEAEALVDMPAIPPIRCPDLAGDARAVWVNDPNLAADRLRLALGSDLGSDDWIALYRYAGHHIQGEGSSWSMFWKENDFYFISLLLMEQTERDRFLAETGEHQDDVHDWLPSDITDGPYIGELGRRSTWTVDPWGTIDSRSMNPRSYRVIKSAVHFHWESHLDSSLTNGFSRQLPIPWLLHTLDLKPDPERVGVFLDASGRSTIWTRGADNGSHLFMRRHALAELEQKTGLAAVWTIIGERQAYSRVGNNRDANGPRIRYNGTMIFKQGEPVIRSWYRPD